MTIETLRGFIHDMLYGYYCIIFLFALFRVGASVTIKGLGRDSDKEQRIDENIFTILLFVMVFVGNSMLK